MTFLRSCLHQVHSGPESCTVKTHDVSQNGVVVTNEEKEEEEE